MLIGVVKILPINYNYLETRDQAVALFEGLKHVCPQCGDLTLDFSDVEYMSRSFADQFHKEKIRWHESTGVNILIENDSDQIKDILKAVSRTQKNIVRDKSTAKVHSLFSRDQIFQYFSKI